ncbi:FtsX-like permease family protein [Mangrovibacterium marinum]|uniref:Lipoprotein-releasing system permease protein n=1 Tax=Mangrovibacterium marinum TaxID=1639118 RepID=A0A2T5C2K7_9BACT|nr:FtsX-like permease family protein [Mangrovibacterium marinum]PTN08948.1 lipoprotein-releasing system permease protein [Mangrovibacterium marinum]
MKLAIHIARRYLISKKSVHVINLISALSVVGVAVGTMALIVVLSAFNGIDGFIQGMLSSFDPDLKLTAVEGKSFSLDRPEIRELMQVEGVAEFMQVVEDNALLQYEDRQKYGVVKGVEANYAGFSGLDSMLVDGQFVLNHNNRMFTVIGQGVAVDLGVGLNFISPIYVYYPKRQQAGRVVLQNAFNRDYLFPSGVFSVQQEIDAQYILVPIDFAREIFELDGRVTSMELKLKPGVEVEDIQAKVKALLGDAYKVQNRYEQHEFLYRVMKSEKWTSFLILSFILIIASFNLLGSLTMIILDKKDDIFILESMGASKHFIRQIFLMEGWLISITGALVGLVGGVGLVWAQSRFELLKLPGSGAFAISAYPVQLQLLDVLATLAIVLAIGFLAAWYPVRSIKK